jgi:hypothetical protein
MGGDGVRVGLQQYWGDPSKPYRFITVGEMEAAFRASAVGRAAAAELAMPPERTEKGAPWHQPPSRNLLGNLFAWDIGLSHMTALGC